MLRRESLSSSTIEPIGIGTDLAKLHREGGFQAISRLRYAEWTAKDTTAWQAWLAYIDLVKVRGKKFSKAEVGIKPEKWIESPQTLEEETQDSWAIPLIQTLTTRELVVV